MGEMSVPTSADMNKHLRTYIFLISRTGISIQAIMSGNSATMSLLLIVILATIFLRAFFFAV